MDLNQFFTAQEQRISFTREQACRFAKSVANDFNAIHDADSSRFCVPGDLLFSVVLSQQGLSQDMRFSFSGMVSDGIKLKVEAKQDQHSCLSDDNGKEYLHIEHSGETMHDDAVILAIIQDYVQFSGRNFPHILVPLLQEQGLMLNRKRPLVIYESMSLHFDNLTLIEPQIKFAGGEYQAKGKKGVALLNFEFFDQGVKVGHGQKRMVLGKLLDFEQSESDLLVHAYTSRRDSFLANNPSV